jgi:hypothetical protein
MLLFDTSTPDVSELSDYQLDQLLQSLPAFEKQPFSLQLAEQDNLWTKMAAFEAG